MSESTTAITLVVLALGPWGESMSGGLVVPRTGILAIVVIAVIGALAFYRSHVNLMRSRNAAVAAQLESAASARAIAKRLVSAQEDERKRIAQELHDDISQRMALLTIGIEARLDDPSDLASMAREVSTELHRLSRTLHPARLQQVGLVPSLRGLARQVDERASATVTFAAGASLAQLDEGVAICLYRIAQEAVSNALRHADAQNVTLSIDVQSEVVVLLVEDDGHGFDLSAVQDEGLGIGGMLERAAAVEGTVRISSEPGSGTRVEARVGGIAAPC